MMGRERRDLRNALLFISPWIIGFSVFVAYPFLASLYYSFCDYNLFEAPVFSGLRNFAFILSDPIFWKALFNTFFYAALSIPLCFLLAFSLALLLNAKVPGQSVYRVVFYLPSLVPLVALSILWLWMFNGEYGIINHFLSFIGVTRPPNWLHDMQYARLAIVFVGLWTLGQSVVIYLAALQEVPRALIEAAEIDGARWYHKIRHVVLPAVSPAILFNVLMGVIWSFQVFTVPYVMSMGATNGQTSGGPGRSTTFYVSYMYQQSFENFRMGTASAMAWILFIIIFGLTIAINRMSEKKVHYME
jgi:multiple sugar transport system permease protein